jgi:hypothetical protein
MNECCLHPHLQELKEGDRFAICAFDENQYWFAGADINQLDAAAAAHANGTTQNAKRTCRSCAR